MRIGIFGGSFNPVHNGHVAVAKKALETLSLDRLVVIPASVSPFKTKALPFLSAEARLALVREAFAGISKVQVDDRELRKGGVSFAIDTVRELKEENPSSELVFLIGEDSLAGLPHWKSFDELSRLCEFKSFERTKESSTEIRRRLKCGEAIDDLAPECVVKFFASMELPRVVNPIIRVTNPCVPLEFDMSKPMEVEVGCGKGRFLVSRAAKNPDCEFLGIERMLERVRSFAGKCRRENIANAHILRLEALYTFHYLLPAHHIRTVYVFFPDPWPKKRHHSHRLFSPLFLNALWKRLETGGKIEFATDHAEYFEAVAEGFAADRRFERVDPMPRTPDVWTEFETMFREQGLPIYSAAWKSLPADDSHLEPLRIPPEQEPRERFLA